MIHRLLAIDPGTTQSSYAMFDGHRNPPFPLKFGTMSNEALLDILRFPQPEFVSDFMAIEMVACYGMPVGREVFETAFWIGRFVQAYNNTYRLIYRNEEKIQMCHSCKANDSTISQALRDIYGDKGTKKAPGLLYGIKGDEWQALSVGVTCFRLFEEEQCNGKPEVRSGT